MEKIAKKLKAQYETLQVEVMKLMEKSSKCLNRLKETSLKTNPLYIPECIDTLIEGEKSEGKPGWKRRVESLMEMKEKAELMARTDKGEKLLH